MIIQFVKLYSLYVLLVIFEIGLLSKRVHDSFAYYYFSGAPSCLHHQALALLYLALRRGLLKNLKGFWNQTSGETRIQKKKFYKTGTEGKENPQTEMREFHKLPFVTK